jgi:hypothetical protein
MTTRASSSRPVYVSTYCHNTPTPTYDAVPFKHIMCDVDPNMGTTSLIQSDTVHTILIGQGWQMHIKAGKPAYAYISKGFTKFAFKVSTCSFVHSLIRAQPTYLIQGHFDSKDYAVFQCQPAKGYTEVLNKQDLLDEI